LSKFTGDYIMSTQTKSNRFTIFRAINEAIELEMESDKDIIVLGEDVGIMGSVWGHTQGLQGRFGADRVRDTPISETGFIGAAVGMAASGMKPVVELMFVDFFGVCMDAIYNLAAKQSYFSGGKVGCPMVILTSVGGGYGDAGQHSQCLYATFGHLPGMKVVIPSNAYDAKGMMTSAMRDGNPVIFMFHKGLHGIGWLGSLPTAVREVPSESYTVPLGKAAIASEGSDVTIVALGIAVHQAVEAAKKLGAKGISAEVIDLRSIAPLDRAAVRDSVRKTGRLLTVDDDYMSYGIGAEIIATICEDPTITLKSSPVRIAYPDVPVPYTRVMEHFILPNADKIFAAVESLMEHAR
jgi:pyruvate/2-oxoglutarate/acetoin dehydrogenase E1 component